MRKIAFFAAGSVCLIAGCTGTGAEYEPVVDGSRGAQYQSDLAACQSLSETKSLMNPETKTQATLGAVVMGAAAGLDDDAGGDRLGSALGGALLGGLNDETISKDRNYCRVGRGFKYLDRSGRARIGAIDPRVCSHTNDY